MDYQKTRSHLERLDTDLHDFPHAHREHPNVGRGGESTVVDGFRCHPLERQLPLRRSVRRVCFKPASQSKVSEFDAILGRHQNVPSRYVPKTKHTD